MKKTYKIFSDESGQSLLEYSILLNFIAIVVFGALQAFGLGVLNIYNGILATWP